MFPILFLIKEQQNFLGWKARLSRGLVSAHGFDPVSSAIPQRFCGAEAQRRVFVLTCPNCCHYLSTLFTCNVLETAETENNEARSKN